MLKLLALQTLERHGGRPKLEELGAIEQLRSHIPRTILERFDRLTAQARPAVAVVRHGICSECHMRIPVAAYSELVNPREVVVCEHCGCYLLIDPDEMPTHTSRRTAQPVSA